MNLFSFYKGANGVVVVFDIGSRSSFEALRRWMSEIQSNCDEIPRILGKKAKFYHQKLLKFQLETKLTDQEALRKLKRKISRQNTACNTSKLPQR